MIAAIEAVGVVIENNSISGWQATDAPGAQMIIDSIATWLPFHKKAKLTRLTDLMQSHVDLFRLIDGGTLTTVTAAQFGNFWATATNNYRTLKAAINAALTPSAVDAIDITAGWPANP